MIKIFRYIWKWIAVSGVLAVFFALQILNLTLFRGALRERKKLGINHNLVHSALWVLGIKLRIKGQFKNAGPYVIVGNHVSWLDTFFLMKLLPTSFVTSTDVQGHSFTGSITKMGGCRFVKRSTTGLRKEMDALHDYFGNGLNLTFYPEATTSDGSALLPFKPALFDLSLKSGVPVAVVAVRYLKINGQPLCNGNKEDVYYYGEVGFMEHFHRVLALRNVEAELVVCGEIDPSGFTDRKELSAEVEKMLNRELYPERVKRNVNLRNAPAKTSQKIPAGCV